jgi:hypothetical protein
VTHMCVLYAGGGRGRGGGIAHRGRARHPHAARCVSALCVTPELAAAPCPGTLSSLWLAPLLDPRRVH